MSEKFELPFWARGDVFDEDIGKEGQLKQPNNMADDNNKNRGTENGDVTPIQKSEDEPFVIEDDEGDKAPLTPLGTERIEVGITTPGKGLPIVSRVPEYVISQLNSVGMGLPKEIIYSPKRNEELGVVLKKDKPIILVYDEKSYVDVRLADRAFAKDRGTLVSKLENLKKDNSTLSQTIEVQEQALAKYNPRDVQIESLDTEEITALVDYYPKNLGITSQGLSASKVGDVVRIVFDNTTLALEMNGQYFFNSNISEGLSQQLRDAQNENLTHQERIKTLITPQPVDLEDVDSKLVEGDRIEDLLGYFKLNGFVRGMIVAERIGNITTINSGVETIGVIYGNTCYLPSKVSRRLVNELETQGIRVVDPLKTELKIASDENTKLKSELEDARTKNNSLLLEKSRLERILSEKRTPVPINPDTLGMTTSSLEGLAELYQHSHPGLVAENLRVSDAGEFKLLCYSHNSETEVLGIKHGDNWYVLRQVAYNFKHDFEVAKARVESLETQLSVAQQSPTSETPEVISNLERAIQEAKAEAERYQLELQEVKRTSERNLQEVIGRERVAREQAEGVRSELNRVQKDYNSLLSSMSSSGTDRIPTQTYDGESVTSADCVEEVLDAAGRRSDSSVRIPVQKKYSFLEDLKAVAVGATTLLALGVAEYSAVVGMMMYNDGKPLKEAITEANKAHVVAWKSFWE